MEREDGKPEGADFKAPGETETEKKEIIRMMTGRDEVSMALKRFAEEKGVTIEEMNEMGTPEMQSLHREWMLQQEDSTEMNNELMHGIKGRWGQVEGLLRKGDQAGALEAMAEVRTMIEKLEGGVKKI